MFIVTLIVDVPPTTARDEIERAFTESMHARSWRGRVVAVEAFHEWVSARTSSPPSEHSAGERNQQAS